MNSSNWMHAAITWLILISTILLSHWKAEWTETYYSEEIYPSLHLALSWIFSWIPFSCLLLCIVYFLYKTVYKLLKINGIEDKLYALQFRMLWVVAFFYIFWGYNYGRLDLETRLNLNHEIIADSSLNALYEVTISNLNRLANTQSTAPSTNIEPFHVKEAMTELGYKNLPKNVSIKAVWPKGLLLRLATAGIYFPYTFEANYDPGLHPLQLSFVKAHEMAHSLGETEESACNFIAYYVCNKSKDLSLNYVAEIALYQYLKHMVPKDIALKGKLSLTPKVAADLDAIKFEMDKYPDILPEARDLIYDTFLRLQGIKDGEKNYSKFIDLLIHWKKKI